MGEAVMGALESVAREAHQVFAAMKTVDSKNKCSPSAGFEQCQDSICTQARTELANARKLLEAAELIVHCNNNDSLSTDWYMAWRQINAAIAACRAETNNHAA